MIDLLAQLLLVRERCESGIRVKALGHMSLDDGTNSDFPDVVVPANHLTGPDKARQSQKRASVEAFLPGYCELHDQP